MKLNTSVLTAFGLLIIVGSFCRVAGFAPQIAMAVFGMAVIKDKRLAFILPLVSMLLSDVLMEVLFQNGYLAYGGFYKGVNFYDSQVLNYVLIASLGLFGLIARNRKWSNIALASLSAPVAYFLASNFLVWMGGAGLNRPHSFEGLMMCYGDALPFLRSALTTTVISSAVLFGGYFLLQRFYAPKKQLA